MAVKFSAFTTRTGTLDASTRIVGYDDPAGTKTNVEFTLSTLVDNVPNIYNSDGNILATRIINDRAGGFTGTAGSNALQMNVRNSGALLIAGYQNNGDPGTTNNCVRWGPGTTAGTMNVRGNLTLSGGGGALSLVNSGGSQFFGLAQTGASINTTGNQEYIAPAIGFGTSASTNYRVRIKGATSTFSGYSLQVQNSSDDEMLSIRDDGAFTLGKGAVSSSDDNVVIGGDATDTASSNSFNVIIGKDASITGTGNQGCVILGDSSLGTATGAVAVGSQAKAQAVNAIAIGQRAQPTGANSITLDSSGSSLTTPSTANAFGVYMTSNTSADLEVVGGGESTLRTSLLIPGTESNITINPDQQDAFTIDSIDGASNDFFTIKRAGAVKVQIGLIGAFNGGISLFDNTQATQLQLRATSTGNFIKPNIHLGGSTDAAEKLEVTGNIKVTGQAYTELHTNATNLVVSWNDGNVQTVTISGSAPTFAPTNPKAGATYILMVTQGATPTGISWNGTVKWSGGAPTLSSTTGQIDVITLICYNATANAGAGAYYGAASLNLVV